MPPAAHSGGSQLRDSPIPPAGRIGILIVGLGGNNGVTTLAGLIANRDGISWESSPPWGRMTANLLGCITQLPSRGGSGGYRERYPLANAISAAVGGWDIRPTPLGQALYASRILDYDLVRQVQDEMDQLPIMPGVWDPDFIGDSQHPTALHGVEPGLSQSQKLDRLRADIVRWKSMQGVEGHTTVIWSARLVYIFLCRDRLFTLTRLARVIAARN
jgi:myo-inositol-1-phosphate synthase